MSTSEPVARRRPRRCQVAVAVTRAMKVAMAASRAGSGSCAAETGEPHEVRVDRSQGQGHLRDPRRPAALPSGARAARAGSSRQRVRPRRPGGGAGRVRPPPARRASRRPSRERRARRAGAESRAGQRRRRRATARGRGRSRRWPRWRGSRGVRPSRCTTTRRRHPCRGRPAARGRPRSRPCGRRPRRPTNPATGPTQTCRPRAIERCARSRFGPDP